jgi:hypothetical protein
VHAAGRMFPLVAPRARLERPTCCLGGTAAPALCRPATTHVTSERNSQRQLLPERSSPASPPPTSTKHVATNRSHRQGLESRSSGPPQRSLTIINMGIWLDHYGGSRQSVQPGSAPMSWAAWRIVPGGRSPARTRSARKWRLPYARCPASIRRFMQPHLLSRTVSLANLLADQVPGLPS